MQMQTKNAKRVTYQYQMHIQETPEAIFPLLCPVLEYEWLPDWRCRIIYTDSGVAELGCVFQTSLDERYGTETWVVSHYEKDRKIAFVRVGEYVSIRFEITLTRQDQCTDMLWSHEITGLTATGNEVVASSTQKEFDAKMQSLENLLSEYLQAHAETPQLSL